MAFRSDVSGRAYPDGTKPTRIVVETRPKQYFNVVQKGRDKIVKESHGWEIVREVIVGPDEVLKDVR